MPKTRHIIDHVSTRSERRMHDFRFAGVDGNRHVAVAQGLDHGKHPGQFFLDRYSLCTRTGGLATNIEYVGTLAPQLPGVRNGGLGGRVLPPIRERIGRHVDNAH